MGNMKKFFLTFTIILQTVLLALGVSVLSVGANGSADVFAYSLNGDGDTVNMSETLSAEAPADLAELQSAQSEQLDYWAKTLTSFDGRQYGYITREKNQGGDGTCWAYAAIGATEASILREGIDPSVNRETLDLDESIAAYARYNNDGSHDPLNLTFNDTYSSDKWRSSGGFADDVFASMTQGFSPVSQKTNDGSYNSDAYIRNNITQSKYFVQSYTAVANNKDAIKRAILQYGAVTMEYKAPPATTTKYHYYSGNELGHASILIGWDDSIPSSSFGANHPKEDGAWIVKNSWGTGGIVVNGTGAFYLSYECHMSGNFYTVDMGMRDDYQNIYHYDGQVATCYRNYMAEAQAAIYEAKLSNATRRELLKAVTVDVSQGDVNVSVKIYKNLTVNAGDVNDKINVPDQGEPVSTTRVHFDKGGFHTIDLEAPVELEQGEYFSVVVSCMGKYDYVPILCSYDYGESTNDMTYRYYGGEWTSYKRSNYYADSSPDSMAARIRAITNTVPREKPLGNDLKYARVEIPERLLFYSAGSSLVPEIKVYFGDELLEADRDYALFITDNDKPGQAGVKIEGRGTYHGERKTSYVIGKCQYPPGRIEGPIEVYSDTVWLHQIPIPENWEWKDDDLKLETGYSYWSYSIIYVGADAEFYQNTTCSFHVDKRNEAPPADIDISAAEIKIESEYTYNGAPIIPAVSVIYSGLKLNVGFDYTVTYKDNTDAGWAVVTVQGVGRYCGQAQTSFEIKKAALPKVRPAGVIYVGRKATNLGDTELGCDNWVWQNAYLPLTGGETTAVAVYTGSDKSNYEQTQMQITVIREERRDIAKATLTLVEESFVYDGAEKKPTVIARDGKITLVSGVDFEVEYRDNVNAGTQAVVTVRGIDCYSGSVELTFAIGKAERTDFSVSLEGWTYGGAGCTPTVTGQKENAAITFTYSADKNGIFTATKPTDAGVYWVKAEIAESGNYRSAQSIAGFVISPKSLAGAEVSVQDGGLKYTGEELKPQVSVRDGLLALAENVDFTVRYENNVNAGTATAIIAGTRNYTGEIKKNFTIAKAESVNFEAVVHNVGKFENLSEVKLPEGFEWKENSLVCVSENVYRATAVYKGSNYAIEELEFEIIIDPAPKKGLSGGGIAAIAVASAAAAAAVCASVIIIRRKRR